jgi:hypothetical protein
MAEKVEAAAQKAAPKAKTSTRKKATAKKARAKKAPYDRKAEIEKIIAKMVNEGDSVNSACKKGQQDEPKGPTRQTVFDWTRKDAKILIDLAIAWKASADYWWTKAIEVVIELLEKINSSYQFKDQEVQAYKLVIQEFRREAAIRNPDRYAEKQNILMDVQGKVTGEGMSAVYEKMREAAKKDG